MLKTQLLAMTSSDPPLTFVDPAYRHDDKFVTAGPVLTLRDARLKWYEIARTQAPVEDDVRLLAQEFLQFEAVTRDWRLGRELGFLMLHRCGGDFYFLILSTWRGSNEIWETVYAKRDAASPSFALFPREEKHKPTFCVWEMAVVAFETAAWKWFLRSPRTAADEEDYLAKRFSGLV